jgi:hypothetical protein
MRGMKIGRRSFVPRPTTKDADLQVLYGSDGTRTRDLRRDRLVPRIRRLATIDVLSLYSCAYAGLGHVNCARLRRPHFERLLPFCCPRTLWQPVAETLRRGADVTKRAAPFDYRRLA